MGSPREDSPLMSRKRRVSISDEAGGTLMNSIASDGQMFMEGMKSMGSMKSMASTCSMKSMASTASQRRRDAVLQVHTSQSIKYHSSLAKRYPPKPGDIRRQS